MPWRITYNGHVEADDYETESDALAAAETMGAAEWYKGGTDQNPHRAMLMLGDGYDIEEYDDPEPDEESFDDALGRKCDAEERFREAWRLKR